MQTKYEIATQAIFYNYMSVSFVYYYILIHQLVMHLGTITGESARGNDAVKANRIRKIAFTASKREH